MTTAGGGAATRRAAQVAALDAFVEHGYNGTTLEEVASRLEITRPALLHHYGSKAELLRCAVEPFLDAVGKVLSGYSEPGPLGPSRRRWLIGEMAAAFAEHHKATVLMMRDIGSINEPSISERIGALGRRFVELLAGPAAAPAKKALARSILGVLQRPMIAKDFDPADVEVRRVLVDAAARAALALDPPAE